MRHKDRGAAAVEFALVLPILLTLVLGTIEFGYAMFVQATVSAAARAGVRDLAIHKSTSSAIDVAVGVGTPAGIDLTGEVTANAAACGSSPPGDVTVTITHNYTGVGALSWFAPGGIPIHGRGAMRCGG